MPTIVIEPEVYKRVEQAAREHNTSTKEILSQATHQYLWELNRRRISEASKIYRQQHAQLKAKYLGQYIAMRDGRWWNTTQISVLYVSDTPALWKHAGDDHNGRRYSRTDLDPARFSSRD